MISNGEKKRKLLLPALPNIPKGIDLEKKEKDGNALIVSFNQKETKLPKLFDPNSKQKEPTFLTNFNQKETQSVPATAIDIKKNEKTSTQNSVTQSKSAIQSILLSFVKDGVQHDIPWSANGITETVMIKLFSSIFVGIHFGPPSLRIDLKRYDEDIFEMFKVLTEERTKTTKEPFTSLEMHCHLIPFFLRAAIMDQRASYPLQIIMSSMIFNFHSKNPTEDKTKLWSAKMCILIWNYFNKYMSISPLHNETTRKLILTTSKSFLQNLFFHLYHNILYISFTREFRYYDVLQECKCAERAKNFTYLQLE